MGAGFKSDASTFVNVCQFLGSETFNLPFDFACLVSTWKSIPE
jgi:hypothetical protein